MEPTSISDSTQGRFLLASVGPRGAGDASSPKGSTAADEAAAMNWRLATILQHFCGGAPLTLYGDEVGMFGGAGAASRAPMWWKAEDGTRPPGYREDFLSLIQWLHIRREMHEPLRRGRLEEVTTDEERRLMVLARTLPGDEVLLAMNLGKEPQKLSLTRGRPGQEIGLLTPQLDPSEKGPPTASPPAIPEGQIPPLRIGGARQFVDEAGQISIYLEGQSARFLIVTDRPPK
jgi:hypothetical protein